MVGITIIGFAVTAILDVVYLLVADCEGMASSGYCMHRSSDLMSLSIGPSYGSTRCVASLTCLSAPLDVLLCLRNICLVQSNGDAYGIVKWLRS